MEPLPESDEEMDAEFVADLNKKHDHDVDFVDREEPEAKKKKQKAKKSADKKGKETPKLKVKPAGEEDEEEMDAEFVADLSKTNKHDVNYVDREVGL